MKTWSIKQAILETYSMEFISLWRMKHQRSRILTKLIKQIQELTERCNYFDVRHVKREANEVACKLAKLASCTNPECACDSQVTEWYPTL
uniref:RNase H type-1 domain-containing protein n=1 Tax=Triticum urartu TaxID=4572 RepID=A0A8R7QK75_TRIUA